MHTSYVHYASYIHVHVQYGPDPINLTLHVTLMLSHSEYRIARMDHDHGDLSRTNSFCAKSKIEPGKWLARGCRWHFTLALIMTATSAPASELTVLATVTIFL